MSGNLLQLSFAVAPESEIEIALEYITILASYVPNEVTFTLPTISKNPYPR